MGAMNAQIRALTGGDVTKERAVLQMDCWRALTELDAKHTIFKNSNQKIWTQVNSLTDMSISGS